MKLIPLRLFFKDWRLQDTLASVFAIASFFLTLRVACHLFSERTTLTQETVMLRAEGERIVRDTKKIRADRETLSDDPQNKARLDEASATLISEKAKEDGLRQQLDEKKRETVEKKKDAAKACGELQEADSKLAKERFSSEQKAKKEGLAKTTFPFEPGPRPSTDWLWLWRGKKKCADELNNALGPFLQEADKMKRAYVEVSRQLEDFKKQYEETQAALKTVRATITTLETQKQELIAIVTSPAVRQQELAAREKELEEQAEATQKRMRNSDTAKSLIFFFHLPLLLYLVVLTITCTLRLLAFRGRLPRVQLEHAH